MNTATYPLTEQFLSANPLFRRTFTRGIAQHAQGLWQVGEMVCGLLKAMAQSDEEYTRYLRSFRRFAVESLREQIHADAHGRNRYEEQGEVYQKVYSAQGIMDRYYLPGMMLSQFAFPNHLTLYLFYRDRFLHALKGGGGLEIGPGHGLLTYELLRTVPDCHLICVEISPVACRFTENVLRVQQISPDRYTIFNGTLEGLEASPGTFRFAICSKVLEHLPNPVQFLERVNGVLSDGGLFYLATDLGVGSVDHLQLFESTDQIRAMVTGAGFSIVDEVVAPIYPDDPTRVHVLDHALILRKER